MHHHVNEGQDISMRTTPLSSFQYRFWLEWLLNPTSNAYTTPLVYRLSGHLNRDALCRALDSFVHRHDEGCRSFFQADGDRVVRQVLERVDVDLAFLDATASAAQTTDQWIAAKTAHTFALDQPVLFRFSLRRVAVDRHVLVLTFPHIISDAFSAAYINDCLTRLYNHHAHAALAPDVDMVDFGQYLTFEAQYQASPRYPEDTAYWCNALAGRQLGVVLPEATSETGWGSYRFDLDVDALASLKKRAKQNRTTLFLIMSSLYAIALARVHDFNDFVMTYPVNMRPPGFKGASGCYVNNLPMWISFAHGQTFREVVAQLTAQRAVSKCHQQLPLTDIVSALRGACSLVETSIFNVSISEAFFVQDTPLGFDGIDSELLPANGMERPFDLNLAYQVGNGIAVNMEFNRSRLSTGQIADFADSFKNLLRAYLQEDDTGIYDVDILSAAQRVRLAGYWHGPRIQRNRGEGLNWVERFTAQVARTPDALAVRFGDACLSYRELDEQSARLAGYLRERGIGAESLVGLCCERSLEMVLSIVAILRAGAAYVPMDPDAPPERLRQIVHDARLTLVLTQQALSGRLPDAGLAVCLLEDKQTWLAARPFACPAIHPDSLAYVIYTSGSTGTPKGVANTHRALINRLDWHGTLLREGQCTRVLQKTPYYFDVSVWEFLWPLQHGFELLVAPPGIHKDPAALRELLIGQRVGVVHFVPSMLTAFLDAVEEHAHAFPDLALVVCSGEALFAEQAELFYRKLPASRLFNLYGPTEAAIDVSAWPCPPDGTGGLACVPIGMPIDNVSLYVLDSNLDPCPAGVRGALYIGGLGLARGYVGRADLTADSFVPDPFAGRPGARMYRSGDTALFGDDGALQYVGRLDEQVKINGNRIELHEVEACLLAFPGVALCAVVPVQIQGRTRQLHAYVETVREAAEWHPERLRDHVAACLPDYMRPVRIDVLDCIGLLPSGKIDRSRLRQMAQAACVHTAQSSREKTAFQTEMAVEWEGVLGVHGASEIAYNDHFFMLGGSSIQAIELIGRINRRYGLLLSPQCLFSSPQLDDFCAKVLMAIGLEAKEHNRLEALLDQLAPEDMDALLNIISTSGVPV